MYVHFTYIALDGEEFSTYEECAEWEEKIRHSFESVYFFTKDMYRLSVTDLDSMNKSYGMADLMFVPDSPTWKEDIKFLFDYYGCNMDGVAAPGWYVYDYNDDDVWKRM